MTSALLALAVVLAVATAVLALVDVVRDRDPGWWTAGALAATELVMLVQLVVGLVKLAGTNRDVSGLPFTAYLVLAVVIPPASFVWAATERTRWGTAVIVVGAVATIALELRLDQIWVAEMPGRTDATLRSGPGRVLVAVYALFALSATGRSVYQLSVQADEAPVPYTLSLVAALIYIVATVALVRGGPTWRLVAWVALSTELAGVIVVGTVSLFVDFPDQTVWSDYGSGYGFVPLVLPMFGMWWLWRTRPRDTPSPPS